LLAKEISHATGVLAEGTEISCLRSNFSIGVTDDCSKSSSLKASFENGHVPGLAKAVFLFFAGKEARRAAFVNYARSWIVVILPGLAVIHLCCATRNFHLNGPINPTSSGSN